MSDSKVRGCDGDCMLLYKQCAVCQRDHDDLFNGRIAEYERLNPPKSPKVTESPLKDQVGGNHYSKLAIQPIEYIYKNNIPFPEGSVIKYVTRWRDKGGIKDLQKAKHFIELLIELENDNVGKAD
jgi:hypothetical protein